MRSSKPLKTSPFTVSISAVYPLCCFHVSGTAFLNSSAFNTHYSWKGYDFVEWGSSISYKGMVTSSAANLFLFSYQKVNSKQKHSTSKFNTWIPTILKSTKNNSALTTLPERKITNMFLWISVTQHDVICFQMWIWISAPLGGLWKWSGATFLYKLTWRLQSTLKSHGRR